MKKVLALALALIMALSMVACGGEKAAETTAAATTAAATEAATTAAPEETTEAAPQASHSEPKEVRGITIPAFSISVNGITVTNEDMAAYPVYECENTSINSKGNAGTSIYQGFALKDICAAAGLTEQYVWASAEASDGYAVEWTKDVMENTTMVAVTKDGTQFKEAPWFAPCSTETSGDFIKGCVKLLVNTTAAAPEIVETTAAETTASGSDGAAELPEIKDSTEKVTFADFSFKVNGEEVNNAKMEGQKIYKISVKVINSKGAESEATYCGYKLADVLAVCGITAPTEVKAVADDGYECEITAEQAMSDYTLLAIEKDKTVGENGTVWVAPCESTSSGDYAKAVVEIQAK